MVSRSGCTLIEVIVALTLLAVGMLGVAGGGLVALRLLTEARAEEGISERALSLLDSLAAAHAAGTGSEQLPGARIDWRAGADTILVTVHAPSGAMFTLRALR